MLVNRVHNRSFNLEINGKEITTPFHFASISSIKTNYDVETYLDIILKLGYPGFLISSYDIAKLDTNQQEAITKRTAVIEKKGILGLLDSGHYEAFWYKDTKWSFGIFGNILSRFPTDLCFSYDVYCDGKTSLDTHLKETVASVYRTASIQSGTTTIPLLHCTESSYPTFARKIVEGLNPEIIGIPERELGQTIIERCENLKRIRDEVDKTGLDVPIHLLGTGNPVSILAYTVCGADLYDGLEWCKTVVDPQTAKLYHFIQKPLFECNCNACILKDVPYYLQTLAHNLIFYKEFTKEIRSAIEANDVDGILEKYFESSVAKKIRGIANL